MNKSTWFLWGLKRSGIHFVVNWLYANCGGLDKHALGVTGLHPQLYDGFHDRRARVSFFNNCGWLNSRQFGLGPIGCGDFDHARTIAETVIFGIEDCRIRPNLTRIPAGDDVGNVLVLRDPLNNIASRLRGQRQRPLVFRVDAAYVDLYDEYCQEYLGWSDFLPNKILINYNRFVVDKEYRDSIAGKMGVQNVDATQEVSAYGGGSSFRGDGPADSSSSLMTRFLEQPIPAELLELLVEREAIREACTSLFGYDIRSLGAQLTGPPLL